MNQRSALPLPNRPPPSRNLPFFWEGHEGNGSDDFHVKLPLAETSKRRPPSILPTMGRVRAPRGTSRAPPTVTPSVAPANSYSQVFGFAFQLAPPEMPPTISPLLPIFALSSPSILPLGAQESVSTVTEPRTSRAYVPPMPGTQLGTVHGPTLMFCSRIRCCASSSRSPLTTSESPAKASSMTAPSSSGKVAVTSSCAK